MPDGTSGTFDVYTLIEPESFQNYSNPIFHIFCYRGLDGDGEVNPNPETVAGSELRQNLRTQSNTQLSVERLRSNGGLPASIRLALRLGRMRFWLRDRLGFGGRLWLRCFRTRFQLVCLGLGEQEDARFKGHFLGANRFGMPHAFVRAVILRAGCKAEITALNKFDDLSSQHGVWFEQPRKSTVEKTLAQARQWPGACVFQCRRPVPIDVSGTDGIIEQRLGLQGADDPPAQRFACAGVPRAEIDDLQAVC